MLGSIASNPEAKGLPSIQQILLTQPLVPMYSLRCHPASESLF